MERTLTNPNVTARVPLYGTSLADGRVQCATCHDPHAEYISSKTHNRTYFLRRQMLKRELCLACHAEGNYQEPQVTVELLAPANNAVVDALPVPLIGTVSDASVEEVVVEINDTRLVLNVRARSFSTLLRLAEGINAVRVGGEGVVPKLMQLLIELRAEARAKKDFATGDKIRNSLTEAGITLEDRKGGVTEWRMGP